MRKTHPIFQQHPRVINSTENTSPSTTGAEMKDHSGMYSCREWMQLKNFTSRLEEEEI